MVENRNALLSNYWSYTYREFSSLFTEYNRFIVYERFTHCRRRCSARCVCASGLATEYGFKSTVLHEDDLRRLGMNMMVAVGQAGREKARLVAIEVGTATDPYVVC